jgi:hypothetical protein
LSPPYPHSRRLAHPHPSHLPDESGGVLVDEVPHLREGGGAVDGPVVNILLLLLLLLLL